MRRFGMRLKLNYWSTVVLVVLMAWSHLALAQAQCTKYRYHWAALGYMTAGEASWQAACSVFVAFVKTQITVGEATGSGYRSTSSWEADGVPNAAGGGCAANYKSIDCHIQSNTCNPPSGRQYIPTGADTFSGPCSQCEQTANVERAGNFTTGWSRHNADAYPEGGSAAETKALEVGAALFGTTQCMNLCLVSVGLPTSVWHARQANSEGLYRLSATYRVTGTGASCTYGSGDAPGNPDKPSPPCNGNKGQVNGTTVCVGGDTNTTNPGALPARKGNPQAGGDGTAPLGSAGGGTGSAAGGPGRSGDGDLRGGSDVPSTGGGGGGSGVPAVFPEPLATCGAPGRPPCKIDETGTPTGTGAFGPANAVLDTAAATVNTSIAESGTKTTGLAWSWGFSLPAGSCSALQLDFGPGRMMAIDPCNNAGVAMWRAALGWMLATLTALYVWRSATASAPGGK